MRPDIDKISVRYERRNIAGFVRPSWDEAADTVRGLIAYIRELEDEARWRDVESEPPPVLDGLQSACVLVEIDAGLHRYTWPGFMKATGAWRDGADSFYIHALRWCPLPKPPEVPK